MWAWFLSKPVPPWLVLPRPPFASAQPGGSSTAAARQMAQDTVVWFVTEALGPPMVMSVPRTVTVLAALPAEVSCAVGVKLPEYASTPPVASAYGPPAGRAGVPLLSTVSDAVRLF